MSYLLALLLLGTAVFLCLIAYLDISPKTGLYKILSRFTTPPESLQPVQTDAPYRRMRAAANRLHRPILLNLETSDGSGQACHPDVVHIPEGFGARKWTYWMACTPYPYGNDFFENPEVFVSYDGIAWDVPEGLRNPIAGSLPIAIDHNSDPDLVFHENQLWLFYRETLRSKTPRENVLYLAKSLNGVNWSKPVRILSENRGAELLSPSALHDGKQFVMWTIEILDGTFFILRRTSHDGERWSDPVTCSASGGIESPRHLWHIDVAQEEGRLSAALVSCIAINGGGARIHYAFSEDEGFHWHISDFLFDQVYEFESMLQYRGSLRRLERPDNIYELWYSAASNTSMWSIAYLRMMREGNRLVPL